MTIDLNREPYFDDYDEDKGFYKVLFRPGFAVQTRELNQIQTMLQKQVERLGEHIFREGSIVLGGAFDLEANIDVVRVSQNNLEAPIEDIINELVDQEVTGQSSGVSAKVRAVDFDEETGDYILFIRYSESSNGTTIFNSGETLISTVFPGIEDFREPPELQETEGDGSVVYRVDVVQSNATGKGSLFSIDEGVVFTKGYFVFFEKQTVVLERFSTSPTYTIGFDVVETIIGSQDDQSLLDNAQGTFNFTAPGADRLAVSANLVKVPLGSRETSDNFVKLLDVREGELFTSNERSQYSRVYEEIAKRTNDESGDYYVRGFGVRSREYLDTGENEGYLKASAIPSTVDSDIQNNPENYLSIDVEPGLAYVKGYEINQLVTEHVPTEKGLDFNFINNQILSARTGGFIRVNEVVGLPVLDQAVSVEFYDTAENRVTSQTRSDATPTGSLLGTAKIKSIAYDSGTLGTSSATFRLYLFDIDVSGTLSDIRSVYFPGTGGTEFFADTVLDSGETKLEGIADNDLLFPLGTEYTRTIRTNNGNVDTSFIFNRSVSSSVNWDVTSGEINIDSLLLNERFPYSDGTLSVGERRDFLIAITADQSLLLPGTVEASGTTVTGTNTSFTNLKVSDRIQVTNPSNTSETEYRYIASITSDTELEVDEAFTITFSSGSEFSRAYFYGDHIDLTATGSSGQLRQVTVGNNGAAININLNEDTSNTTGTSSVFVTHLIQRSTAKEIEKRLRPSRYVKIDCSALPNLTDPIDLGFSDVYQIRQIRKDTSEITTDTQGSDVTNEFTFDNGQKDNYYGHGTITPVSDLTASDYLLIELDYFEPVFSGSFGYFSLDSYPIDDTQATDTTIFTYEIPTYTNSSGNRYNLRNVLDFRPVKTNVANDATSVSAASSNADFTPNVLSTDDFIIDSDGARIAAPASRINLDYSYYLARRDVITLDKEGQFGVVRGDSAEFPVTPNVSDNVMGIANVYIPPFPSISGTLGRLLNRRDSSVNTKKIANIRHTQRDIGVLKKRVDNLEFYNALSLLEKNTADFKILDETGLDRFKNGFFVDGFMDHSLGSTQNPDYNIAVDKVEKSIRPTFEMESFGYDFDDSQSTGIQKSNGLVSLPFTEETLIEQLNVTTIRNIEQSVFRYIGDLRLEPSGDNWVDTRTADRTNEFGNDLDDSGKTIFNSEWGSWETYASGYNVYRQSGSWSGLRLVDGRVKADADKVGQFNSYADALKATKAQAEYLRPGYIEGVLEPFDDQTRTGIQATVTYDKEPEELGNLILDTSVVPYIRPQTIELYAQGLKARTQYYVFFDGEDMTDYVTPIEGELRPREVINLNDPSTYIIPDTVANGVVIGNYTSFGSNFPLSDTIQRVGSEELDPPSLGTGIIGATGHIGGQSDFEDIVQTRTKINLQRVFKLTYQINRGGGLNKSWGQAPDSHYGGEEFYLEYSLDGNTWVQMDINGIREFPADTWVTREVVVPEAAKVEEGVFIRFYQQGRHASTPLYPCDTWAFTSLLIEGYDYQNEGDDLFSDQYGDVQALLRLPEFGKRFRVGNKEVIITDNITNDPATTSYAKSNFYASGIDIQKQNTILSTLTATVVTDTVGDERRRVQNVKRLGPSCMAYSFRPDAPSDVEGIFLSSVDVFIQSMDEELGVWFEIREMDSGGNITRTQVPYSKVWMKRSDPRIRFWDGEGDPVATNVNFDSPVFLYNDTQYAFVIHTEGLNPNTYFWVSRLGQEDLITGNPVTGRQLTGTLFTTNNDLNYDIVPDLDMMVRFNRAKFDTSAAGTVILGNKPYEFVNISNVSSQFDTIGEDLLGSEKITVSNLSGQDTVVETDVIIGTTSGATATVVNVLGSNYSTDGNGFEEDEAFTVEAENGTSKDVTGTITNIEFGEGKLSTYNNSESVMIISHSNGRFFEDCTITGERSGNTATLDSFTTSDYSTTNLKPDFLSFNNTRCQFEKRGFDKSAGFFSDWVPGEPDGTTSYDTELSVISKSVQADVIGSDQPSSQVRATMTSNTDYLSPVIDTSRAHAVYVYNLINSDTTGEDSKSGGNLINKYISKTVTLDEGQDAESLIVYLTMYRPPITSDVKVWMKIRHREDVEEISDKDWIELENLNDGFSSKVNQNNFIEGEFVIPSEYLNESDIVEYDSNGNTFTGFKQFSVKVGLIGDDSASVPRVADLRAIALQV